MRTLLTIFALVAVGLAGCTDDASPTDETTIATGKGAIAGLLVDDRFRPLQLTDSPNTEFQASGFILVQETGDKLTTTVNGEFQALNLEPGIYTLRATVDGHEVTPATIEVRTGEFTEITLLARRVLSDAGAVITQEYVVFIGCSVTLLMQLNFNQCDADMSGDSDRSSLDTDYTGVSNVTHLVIEMKANQAAPYEVDVWWVPPIESTEDSHWYASSIFEGDYVKQMLTYGEASEQSDFTPSDPWNNEKPFQTDLLVFGQHHEETSTAERALQPDENPFLTGGGVGVRLGVEARFMHSLFIGEPAEDLTTYCLLC